MMKQTKKAFTLVELIIVITILAILATIGFMSYQSYTADARNSKRVNDISSLQSKLEISVAKSIDILTFASGVTANQVAATLTAGSGTVLSGATNYVAGDVKYATFGVNAADFSDPDSSKSYPAYKLGVVKSTNKGALYQFVATLEAVSDDTKKSLVKGLFLTGAGDTAAGLVKGTTSTTGLVDKSADTAY
ncbi:MAG: prepilin-type N-terminal cleavage/methylation domain-containing protein [Candidatus Gracilibacteria bacterium]|nr:prepilin-type N-terminal cleavage/methylation domain-containing protein [Candidatus Gracilibacteria bacterium]